MRFIHVSDVHLGMIPDKGKPWSDVRAKEIEETFDRILDIAEREKGRSAPHCRQSVSQCAEGCGSCKA